MRPWRASTPVRWPVGLKFAVAIGAVAIGVLSVAVTAAIGLMQLQSDVERLISDDLASVRVVDDLAISLYLSEEAVLAEQAAVGPERAPSALLD
jgi:ABC-type antimicrobial peptide transport system permease subunit